MNKKQWTFLIATSLIFLPLTIIWFTISGIFLIVAWIYYNITYDKYFSLKETYYKLDD